MPRLSLTSALVVAALVGIGVVWFGTPSWATNFGHRRHQCQPCCIQYVIVQVPGPPSGPGGGQERVKNPDNPADVRVHFLFVLDTEDKDVGYEIARNGNKVREIYESILRRDFQGRSRTVDGTNLTKEAVVKALDELIAGAKPQDSIVVYCQTHGKPDRDGGQAILMHDAGTITDPKEKVEKLELPRKTLEDALQKAPVRLKLLLTDCCYQTRKRGLGGLTPEPDPTDVMGMAGTFKKRPANLAAYQTVVAEDLFVNHAGFLSLNSAKPKEYAVTEVFTPALLDLIKGWPNATQNNGEARWEDFLKVLEKDVDDRFVGLRDTWSANTKLTLDKNKEAETETTKKKGPGQQTQTLYPAPNTTAPKYGIPPVDQKATTPDAKDTPASVPAPEKEPEKEIVTRLSINFSPGSKLSVDGRAIDAQLTSPVLYELPIPAGQTKSVTIRSTGGAEVTRQVTITAGQAQEVDLTSPTAATPAPAASAEVFVKIPEGAELYVNGILHPHKLTERILETPPLASERVYMLSLRVKLVQNGKEMSASRQLDLRTGQKIDVDFTGDASLAAK